MAMRISTPAVSPEKVLVNAWNLPASGIVYVRVDCNKLSPATSAVDWRVNSNKASTILFYKSMRVANTGTITFTDATKPDDGDTFWLNNVAITAEATEEDAVGNKFFIGATADLIASAAAACINANVPGVTATAALHVVTIAPSVDSPAPTLLFQLAANGDGTQAADANEVAWVDATLGWLRKDTSMTQKTGADNTTYMGDIYQQFVDGYPYAYIGYTDTSAAITALTVGAILHDSI